ncbi:MAG: hypothetical protein CMJ93_04755 [Planctomycetes bacterium]|nr:hypothetical protein [Planctomycetota bacterium]
MVLSFEDTPLSDWFAKNRVTLTLFIVVVFGGIYALEQWPSWQADKMAKSWALYQTVSGDVNLDENLGEKLAQAEQDQLTYPWFVYTTTRLALQAKNTDALNMLKLHLEKIAASEEGKAWVADNNGQTRPIADILLDSINGREANTLDFDNPAPGGDTYIITLSDSNENSYEIVASMFSESPLSAEHFAANADGLVGAEITNFNNISLTAENGLGEAATVEIERARLFHSAGVLCTVPGEDRDGSQKANVIQILLEDNFYADGQSSVFGAITSGLNEIKVAAAELASGQVLTITAVTKA